MTRKICFFGDIGSSFIQRDYCFLKQHYKILLCDKPHKKPMELFFIPIKIFQSDLTYIWFGGYWASYLTIISKLLGKKVVIIVGGYDAANVEEISYGAFVKKIPKLLVKLSYVFCDIIIVVDESLKKDLIRNGNVDSKKIFVVPTGYDSEHFKPGWRTKEDLVITVSRIDEKYFKRKGLKTFIECAKSLTSIKFAIIGSVDHQFFNSIIDTIPPNLSITGYVTDVELLDWYQRAKIYCQLSRYEGLPNSLCEAMLCGCYPIGTEYCGIPNAIGDTGLYVKYDDTEGTIAAINVAMNTEGDVSSIRNRIMEKFPKCNRELALMEIINDISND